jgi:hypothetical protein
MYAHDSMRKATAQTERVIADGHAVEVARLKITEAGRRALTGRLT